MEQGVWWVRRFLATVSRSRIYTTDFAGHTVGIRMAKLGLLDKFVKFAESWGQNLVRLDIADFRTLQNAAQNFRLDFDDAYQVTAAEKLAKQTGCSVVIVSYDPDIDRAPCQRLTPEEALKLEQRR